MITVDYGGGEGGKKCQKIDYVICERPLTQKSLNKLSDCQPPHMPTLTPQVGLQFHEKKVFDNVNRNSFGNIKDEMKLICEWLRINKLSLNAKKTKFMIFDNSDQLDTINITIDEDYTFTIKEQKVRIKKYLGLVLDHKLKFDEHIDYLKKRLVNVLVLCTNQKIYCH